MRSMRPHRIQPNMSNAAQVFMVGTCRKAGPLWLLLLALLIVVPSNASAACNRADGGLGVQRVIEIDTEAGPLFGDISRLQKEIDLLEDKEVVLTFDDGPVPWVTTPILDTLDAFCTKATFFSVGRMALAYPKAVRDILYRGHTLGGHTWSHPLNIRRMSPAKAIAEIEKGFAAISVASGGAVSPFFRFPGLSDSNVLLQHLQERGIATFTVDVVSDDSFISNADRLADLTLQRIFARGKGIVLFHDIKRVTAKALPVILEALVKRGYKVVHLRAKRSLEPLPELAADAQAAFDKKWPAAKLTAAAERTTKLAAERTTKPAAERTTKPAAERTTKPDPGDTTASLSGAAKGATKAEAPIEAARGANGIVRPTGDAATTAADASEPSATAPVLRFFSPPPANAAPIEFLRPEPRQRGPGPLIAAPLPERKPTQSTPKNETETGALAQDLENSEVAPLPQADGAMTAEPNAPAATEARVLTPTVEDVAPADPDAPAAEPQLPLAGPSALTPPSSGVAPAEPE